MQISEPAEYMLLGLLMERPMHGYEMFQHCSGGTLGEILHLEMSQMYAYLKKLERLHYISAQTTQHGTRPPRKIFHLTEQGRTLFLHWLREPVEKPRDIRILFLIKFYFLQFLLPEQMLELLRRQAWVCERFLQQLESRQRELPTTREETFLKRVVLRSRIYQTRALLDWLRELQEELSQLPQSL